MDSFFKLIAAGPAFFVSAWLLMVFAGKSGTCYVYTLSVE